MSVQVKVCGVTRVDDAREAVNAGVFAIGLNFWEHSLRHVSPEQARAVAEAVRGETLLVGVFVNAPRETIELKIREYGLGAIQLHGDETPADCQGWDVPVIKALRVEGSDDPATAAARYGTEWILLDSGGGGRYGGTGKPFAWEAAAGVPRERLVLAGGLTAENVAEAVRRVRPFAVDVASGVEIRPGVKDAAKMKEFIDHATHA